MMGRTRGGQSRRKLESGHVNKKVQKERECLRQISEELSGRERALAFFLWSHPHGISAEFLEELTGIKVGELRPLLEDFEKRSWIKPSTKKTREWSWVLSEGGEEAADRLDPRWGYRWNIMAGKLLEARGEPTHAPEYFSHALRCADKDFKKAYATGLLAKAWASLSSFDKSLDTLREALVLAEKIDWPDFVQDYCLLLAQLTGRLGRYGETESYLRKALSILKGRGFASAYLQGQLNLGTILLEQARYGEALSLFSDCEAQLKKKGESFEQAMAAISLAQTYNGLGMTRKTVVTLKRVKDLLGPEKLEILKPYLRLLEGKFDFNQGRIAGGLRKLEEAAHDFEKMGDISGKVEVLLSMSAPFLEHDLIKEAHGIIDLLADWKELKNYPALEHSVHLRRLALGAFTGTWVQEDVDLVAQDFSVLGSREDWLQFWFHMALAGKKIRNTEFFEVFITQARAIVESIAQGLEESQRASFLKRPDIVRVLRLAEAMPSEEEPSVEAERAGPAEGPAEAASLAPPIHRKKKKKK